jgi:phage tail sheath gpL-like
MALDRKEHAQDAIAELQGLKFVLLAGNVAANTKMDLAAIRAKDTILAAVLEDTTSGVSTDDTANFTISDIRATGTFTIAAGNVADGETVTVGDQVFTFVAGLSSVRKLVHSGGANVPVGATNNDSAANLNEAINLVFGRDKVFGVTSSVTTNVVTVTARQEGAVGNSIALAEATANVTISGATLAGGTDTGGVESSTITTGSQVLLWWYQKAHELSPK